MVKSFVNCVNTNCIEEKYIKQNQCLPNPFIYENFKLINSNQTEHRICDQKYKLISKSMKIIAKMICIKECNEIYFSTRFDNSLVLNIQRNQKY